MLPVAQELRHPTGGEHGGHAGDEVAHQVVARGTAVAVFEQATGAQGGGGNDEGRVGDDEVEGLAGHRLQHRAGAQTGVDARDRQVRPCDRQGARGDVGGRDVVRVAGGQDGLHAAAGAQVQDAPDGLAHGEFGQRE